MTLDNLSGMGWERPFLGFALALFAFAFIGLPPGGLFTGKLYAFSAAVEADMTWLVIVGVVATAVSVYYYLAIVRSLYMRAELQLAPVGGAPPRELLLSSSIALSLGVVFASFILVQPLIDLAEKAITSCLCSGVRAASPRPAGSSRSATASSRPSSSRLEAASARTRSATATSSTATKSTRSARRAGDSCSRPGRTGSAMAVTSMAAACISSR